MLTPTTRPSGAQTGIAHTTQADTRTNLVLRAAAYLLTTAALAFAAVAGFSRGADGPSSLAWAAVGIAAVMGAAAIPAAMRNAARGRDYWKAALLAPAYVLAVAMAITTALGNAHGGRALQAASADAQAGQIKRAQADYERAVAELASLPASRPVAEIAPLITPLSAKIGNANCADWVPNKAARAACIARSELQAELGRSERRTQLQAEIAAASTALGNTKPSAPANADAETLALYMQAIGLPVQPASVVLWLQLIAVGLVELAPGLLLAAADTARTQTRRGDDGQPEPSPASPPMDSGVPHRPDSVPDHGRARSAAIIEQLRHGALEGRQADIARALAVPKTSLRRMVEADPALRLRALPGGVSRLELVA